MPLELMSVRGGEMPVLENLVHLYLHEISVYEPREIESDGMYRLDGMATWFDDDKKFPFFVRVKGKLAGFAMVRRLDSLAPEPTYSLSHLFMLETYRQLGIGEEIARSLFDQFQGHWQVGVPQENKVGRQFCRRVLYRYTSGDFGEVRLKGFEGPVFVFRSPSERPEANKVPSHNRVRVTMAFES